MKVLTSRFVAFSDCGGKQPTHGVYSQAGWELLGDKAYPISLHWSYDAAVDAAARAEMAGHPRVVVCFEHSIVKVVAMRKREAVASKADFEWDDAPHHEPEF